MVFEEERSHSRLRRNRPRGVTPSLDNRRKGSESLMDLVMSD